MGIKFSPFGGHTMQQLFDYADAKDGKKDGKVTVKSLKKAEKEAKKEGGPGPDGKAYSSVLKHLGGKKDSFTINRNLFNTWSGLRNPDD
jgi:hypothetical protein